MLGGAIGGPLTFSGTLGGPGDLIKGGLRTMTITGDNSAYAGDLVVSSGRVTLGNGGTTGKLGTGGIVVGQSASIVFNRSDATTISQGITGAGSIIQEGPGELTFDGVANTSFRFQIEPGTTVVNDGIINVLYINVEGQLKMDQPDSSVTVNDFNVGDLLAGPSSFLFSDGIVTASSVFAGKNAGTDGVIVQTGGTFIDRPGGDSRIGGINGGASEVWGAWRVLGGTIEGNSNFQIGAYGTGIMEVDGGTVNFNDGYAVVGRFHESGSVSYGLLDIRSGTVNQTNIDRRLIIAEGGYGTLNVRGTGVLNLTGGLFVGGDGEGIGDASVNLHTGGVIETRLIDQLNAGGARGTFNFHGGLLKAKANESNFFGNVDNAYIHAGGAKIDTNGFNVTAQQGFSDPTGNGVKTIPVTNGGSGYLAPPFVEITGGGGNGATAIANLTGGVVTSITVTNPGTDYDSVPTVNLRGGGAGSGLIVGTPTLAANTPGTFTKLGAGTLALNGTSNYTGATRVEEGNLQINGYNADATGTITVDVGATLSGVGNIKKATILGTIAPGAPTGTLFAEELTLKPGAKFLVNVDGNAMSHGSLDVFNKLDITGAVLDANVVGTGTFPYVIANANTIVGDFASVAPGIEYTKTATQIILTKAGTPFQSYIGSYFPGESAQAIIGPDADPDNDGTSNLAEFALNSDPTSGAASGKVVSKVANVGGAPTLVLTLPVRNGATFSGATAQESATVDGVQYRIEGSDDLVVWNLAVAEVTGADKTTIEAGLPALSADWEYRTFRSPGSIVGDPAEFLRAAISMP